MVVEKGNRNGNGGRGVDGLGVELSCIELTWFVRWWVFLGGGLDLGLGWVGLLFLCCVEERDREIDRFYGGGPFPGYPCEEMSRFLVDKNLWV